jgi:3-oxoacyl-[acyl-carrier protein] reductase
MMMSPADWEEVIRTNLFGVFYTSKMVVRSMAARKSGCIINIASVAAIHGAPGQSNYAASKGGIIAFTKSTAMELIGNGIRVNCILPGFIETDMTHKLSPDMRKEVVRQVPCGRMGKPEEIAHLAAFLASDCAAYIVGQSIVIDGGLTHGSNG